MGGRVLEDNGEDEKDDDDDAGLDDDDEEDDDDDDVLGDMETDNNGSADGKKSIWDEY